MTQEPWLPPASSAGPDPAPEPSTAPVPDAGPVASPQTPARTPRGWGLLATVVVAAVVAFIVGGFAGIGGFALGRAVERAADRSAGTAETSVGQNSSTAAATPVLPQGQETVAAIASATLPSVVSILAEGTQQSGSGSGFVIRPDGYLLTNNHVVDLVADGGTLTVVFSDGTRADGKVVGTSTAYDLAVVKVAKNGLPAVQLGDSSAVNVGDAAVAIGAPLGLDGTVTSGIVSALDRPVTAGDQADVSYINAIQTDAAINPGNSGGPLLDMHGHVIGINSAIASMATGSEAGSIGLGFAIPSNSAKRIADEIIATGKSSTPLMGVVLDQQFAGPGARVSEITSGSGADQAGLEAGDVIVKVDDRSIDDATELVVAVRDYAPGDRIVVVFQRGSQDRSVELVLGDGGE